MLQGKPDPNCQACVKAFAESVGPDAEPGVFECARHGVRIETTRQYYSIRAELTAAGRKMAKG